jgi:hypothetical protein
MTRGVRVVPLILSVVFLASGCGTAGSRTETRTRGASPVTQAADVCSQTEACSDKNAAKVPAVVGMTITRAAEVLASKHYACQVVEIRTVGSGEAEVVWQSPEAEAEGSWSQAVHISLAAPDDYEPNDLPASCVNRS